MKNLHTSLLGRIVTLTDDTTNRPYVIVAVWLTDGAHTTPSIALESVNQFGKSVGGPIVTCFLTDASLR
jgi:hypothetical protein